MKTRRTPIWDRKTYRYYFSNGDMVSLNDEQIDYILKYIDKNQVFNMSLERAFQYSRIIKPLRECEDELSLE